MKLKSIALVVAPLVLGSHVLAEGTVGGGYVGAGVGYTMLQHRVTNVVAPVAPAAPATRQFSFNADGINGALLLGYGKLFHCFYLGVEGYGSLDGTSKSVFQATDGTGPTTVKLKGTWGLAARLGYALTKETLAYVRLGAEWGRFSWSDRSETPAVLGSSWLTAFAPGLGIETNFNTRWALRVDGSWAFYGSKSARNNPTAAQTGSRQRYKERTTGIRVALVYRFMN
jgi:opacity protein-like surface antigen